MRGICRDARKRVRSVLGRVSTEGWEARGAGGVQAGADAGDAPGDPGRDHALREGEAAVRGFLPPKNLADSGPLDGRVRDAADVASATGRLAGRVPTVHGGA